jgi:hypothetical protein
MIAADLIVNMLLENPNGGPVTASIGAYRVMRNLVDRGEFAGQEELFLATIENEKTKKLLTLAHRWEQNRSDRLTKIGSYLIAELNLGADVRFTSIIKVEGNKASFVPLFDDANLRHVAGTDVVRIGDVLVGCVWVSPDFRPKDGGHYMFVVRKNRVVWGQLPENEGGYSCTPGKKKDTFMLTFHGSREAKTRSYRWPPSLVSGKWKLASAQG